MGTTIFLNIISLFYVFLLAGVYFSKERIKNFENSIFSTLVIAIISQLLTGLLIYYTMINFTDNISLNKIFNKIYLTTILLWIIQFTMYTFIISFKKVDFKKVSRIFNTIYFILIIIMFILPLELKYIDENTMYSNGPSINLLYLTSIICISVMTISVIKNRKNIINKKYLPLLSFILFGVFVLIIQLIIIRHIKKK